MGHPDFRVRKKIFATLSEEEDWGMVKLTPEQQEEFVEAHPRLFAPIKGGWGRMGCTQVIFGGAGRAALRKAMIAAWCNAAPKRLAKEHFPRCAGE